MDEKCVKYENELRENGLKVTRSRTAVLMALCEFDQPVSAEQLFRVLPVEENINLSTVYRTLAVLEEKQIIAKLSLMGDEKMLYTYNHLEHRHYLICAKCRKILTIAHCPLGDYEQTLEQKTGFEILGHNLYLYGYCPECRKNSK